MPNYTFENKRTKKRHTEWLSMSELDTYLEKNKNLRQVLTSINIVGGVGGITHKTDGGWKDNLSRIAKANNMSLAELLDKNPEYKMVHFQIHILIVVLCQLFRKYPI